MLNHLGHKEHARVIYEATYETVVNDGIRTPGLSIKLVQNSVLKNIYFLVCRFRWLRFQH